MELSLGAVLPQAEIQPSKPRDVRLLVGALSASVVGLGCNQFGATCDAGEAARLVAAALECGIDFFDVADEYGPDGLAEEYLGGALAGHRAEVTIATKFGSRLGSDPAGGGASRKWIETAAEASLAGYRPIVSVQDRYNLLRQEAADELLPAAREAGLAFIPYFPLASGMLGGRYRKGQPPPRDSRFHRHVDPGQAKHMIDRDAGWPRSRGGR